MLAVAVHRRTLARQGPWSLHAHCTKRALKPTSIPQHGLEATQDLVDKELNVALREGSAVLDPRMQVRIVDLTRAKATLQYT